MNHIFRFLLDKQTYSIIYEKFDQTLPWKNFKVTSGQKLYDGRETGNTSIFLIGLGSVHCFAWWGFQGCL